jgi:hypothetical protein
MENNTSNSTENNTDISTENNKVKLIKVSYLWRSNNRFLCRNRIIRTNEKNVNIPILHTYDGIKEILVQPRHIALDPFKNDDSLLIMSEIFDAKGNRLSNDKRSDLVKLLNGKKEIIEEHKPRFNFSVKINILEENKFVVLQNIAETLTNVAIKSRININQYYFENENTIVIENEFNNCLDFLDEFLLLEYILFRVSEIMDFKYKIINQFTYKFLDKNTSSENGIDKLTEYSKKLNQMNVIIPETVERLKQGYLIDTTFNINECLYEKFVTVIKSLYE